MDLEFADHSNGSWLLATYLIPGWERGQVQLDLKVCAVAGSGSRGDAGGGVWECENLESQRVQEIACLRMRIRRVQKVCSVLMSRGKAYPDPSWDNLLFDVFLWIKTIRFSIFWLISFVG